MSVYQFKAPKGKRRVHCSKEPPFPVPIESINEYPASNSRWRYYTGFVHGNHVLVKHSGDMQFLYSMGFFGEGNLSDRGIAGDVRSGVPKVISRRRYMHRLSWARQRSERLNGKDNNTDDDSIKEYEQLCDTAAQGHLTSQNQVSHKNLSQDKNVEIKAANVAAKWQSLSGQQMDETYNDLNGRQCEEEITSQELQESFRSEKFNTVVETHEEDDWSGEADHNFWGTCSDESERGKVSDQWKKDSGCSFWSSENIQYPDVTNKPGSSCQEAKDSGLKTEMLNDSNVEILKAAESMDDKNIMETTELSGSQESVSNYIELVSKDNDEQSNDANEDVEYDPQSLVNDTEGNLIVQDDSNDEEDVDIKKLRPGWRLCRKIDPYPLSEYLQLTLQEAYFLSFGLGCLVVYDEDQNKLDLVQMWRLFSDKSPMFVPHYITYHHFRSKGWVPKVGVKFGADYTLYVQGPPFYHASFTLLIQPLLSNLTPDPYFKAEPLTWTRLARFYRVTETVNKDLLLCDVIRPDNLDIHELLHPSCISKFKIKETVVKKWIPSQEREGQGKGNLV